MMIALAMLLVKKATIEPKLAFKSFVHIEILHKFNCKTATKGIMIMPNGGKTKQPTSTPISATYSLIFEPPYLLTKYLFIAKSEINMSTVNTIIDT